MKAEEIEKDNCGTPTRKVLFFEILSDLNQAVYPANTLDSRLRGD